MKPALSQVCSLPAPWEQNLADYAAGQCPAVEAWITKLEDYLRTRTVDDLRQLLARHGLTMPVASYQGGLLSSQGEARREAWQLFERRLDLCRDVGIGTLVVACDVPRPLAATDLERVKFSLRQAAEAAQARQLRVALEFQATSAIGNNLESAAALVAETAHPHLGLCLDVFHFHVGPSKDHDLGWLTPENLFHVQVCDLLATPRELATDAQRILPGDGDLPLAPILDRLRAIQYDGLVSVELMNPQIWQVPPRQFGEIAMSALRSLLEQNPRRPLPGH